MITLLSCDAAILPKSVLQSSEVMVEDAEICWTREKLPANMIMSGPDVQAVKGTPSTLPTENCGVPTMMNDVVVMMI